MMLREDATTIAAVDERTTIRGERSQDISMMRISNFRYGKFPARI
jgi:hypothetical protein